MIDTTTFSKLKYLEYGTCDVNRLKDAETAGITELVETLAKAVVNLGDEVAFLLAERQDSLDRKRPSLGVQSCRSPRRQKRRANG